MCVCVCVMVGCTWLNDKIHLPAFAHAFMGGSSGGRRRVVGKVDFNKMMREVKE